MVDGLVDIDLGQGLFNARIWFNLSLRTAHKLPPTAQDHRLWHYSLGQGLSSVAGNISELRPYSDLGAGYARHWFIEHLTKSSSCLVIPRVPQNHRQRTPYRLAYKELFDVGNIDMDGEVNGSDTFLPRGPRCSDRDMSWNMTNQARGSRSFT